MQKKGGNADRWFAAAAALAIALGAMMISAGVASGSTLLGTRPVIKFWDSYNEVTLAIPSARPCPATKPSCVWILSVNEDVPAQTLVGEATGTSGILTVAYPSDFCGVIQADAILGPPPLSLIFGHRRTIETVTPCPGTTPTPTGSTTATSTTTTSTTTTSTTSTTSTTTTSTTSTTTTTTAPQQSTGSTSTTTTSSTQPTPAAVSQLPFTGSSTTTGVPATSAGSPQGSTEPAPAELPFTGADFKPLVFLGAVLVLTGIFILTTIEQRRRTFRRVTRAAQSSAAGEYASRASRWFLGE